MRKFRMIDAQNSILKMVKPFLKSIEFEKKKRLLFYRAFDNRNEKIAFRTYRDRIGNIRFTFSVGIVIPSINSIIYSEFEENIFISTIGVPIHFLHTDRGYFDWKISENTNIEELREKIIYEIKTYALPFFSRYKNLETIYETVESENPRDWFILNPEQRILLLATIEFVQGKREKSLKTLEQALEKRKDSHPKKRYKLQDLYNKFLNS